MPCGVTRRTSVVQCKCGDVHTVFNSSLAEGTSTCCKTCGLRKHITHGRSRTRAYKELAGIKQRIFNEKNAGFENYGGRGLTLCEEWENPTRFLDDMGPGKKGWTIERVDNEKGYSLENCVWATRAQQNGNKRTTWRVTVRGISGCLWHVCAHFGVNPDRTKYRLRHGWPIELAFFTPKGSTLKRALKNIQIGRPY